MDFRGQVVWITGASAGIGEALARELAQHGARLVLSARNAAELRRVAAACAPAETLVLPLDLAAPATFAAAVAAVQARFGRLDVLLNNGGISQRSLALETSLEVDRRLMEVDYFGPVALTKAVLPGMVAQGSGRVVVISSLVGKFGTPYRSAYSAAKHALHGFFDSLRAELHGSGVGISIICPGFIRTGVSVNALTGDGRALGQMDEATAAGLAPAEFARRAVRALVRERDEVAIGGRETWGVLLKRLAPGLFARVLRGTRAVCAGVAAGQRALKNPNGGPRGYLSHLAGIERHGYFNSGARDALWCCQPAADGLRRWLGGGFPGAFPAAGR